MGNQKGSTRIVQVSRCRLAFQWHLHAQSRCYCPTKKTFSSECRASERITPISWIAHSLSADTKILDRAITHNSPLFNRLSLVVFALQKSVSHFFKPTRLSQKSTPLAMHVNDCVTRCEEKYISSLQSRLSSTQNSLDGESIGPFLGWFVALQTLPRGRAASWVRKELDTMNEMIRKQGLNWQCGLYDDDKITGWKLQDILEDEKSKPILTVNSGQRPRRSST